MYTNFAWTPGFH